MTSHEDRSLQDELDELESQLEEAEGEITTIDKAVKDSQKELDAAKARQKALADQVADLKRTTDENKKIAEDAAKARERLAAELVAAAKAAESHRAGVYKQLAPEHIRQIEAIRNKVDKGIGDNEHDLNENKELLPQAETRLEEARAASRQADSALAAAQVSLRALSAEIQAVRGQVSSLKSALESAYAKDQLADALVLQLDLVQALVKLNGLLKLETVNARVQAVESAQSEAREAKVKLQEAATGLDSLKDTIAQKDKELQDAQKGRAKAIKVAIEKLEAVPAPAPNGQPETAAEREWAVP